MLQTDLERQWERQQLQRLQFAIQVFGTPRSPVRALEEPCRQPSHGGTHLSEWLLGAVWAGLSLGRSICCQQLLGHQQLCVPPQQTAGPSLVQEGPPRGDMGVPPLCGTFKRLSIS